jgi:hypothetical protein
MKTSDHKAITEIVCEYFQIKKEDLFVKNKDTRLVIIRHINYYMIRKFTKLSLKSIGQETTGAEYSFKQSYSNVIHAVRNISCLKTYDKDIQLKCVSIESLINQLIDTADIEYLKVLLVKSIRKTCTVDQLIKALEDEKKALEKEFKTK